MKVLTVIGARPQFIKAAVVSREFRGRGDITEVILHTGQHFDDNMSGGFFKELDIPEPKYNLGISSLSHGAMTGRMTEGIENVLKEERPDTVLLYGDTNSTLAGALAAVKLHIPAAHVEAGLRSFNNRMPEEINRILTDRISSLLFVPTERAAENLRNEGFGNFGCRIIQSGDVMYDSFLFNKRYMKRPDIEIPGKYVLSTIHRPEMTASKENLTSVLGSLDSLPLPVLLVLHPGTRKILEENGLTGKYGNIAFSDPLSYKELLFLLDKCSLVATDSGGLQKEAFFSGKYCVTLREQSEWTELTENGFNIVSGYDGAIIRGSVSDLLGRPVFIPEEHPFYGKGEAGKLICETLSDKPGI